MAKEYFVLEQKRPSIIFSGGRKTFWVMGKLREAETQKCGYGEVRYIV